MSFDNLNIGYFSNGKWESASGKEQIIYSPQNGKPIGSFNIPNNDQINETLNHALVAQKKWQKTPLKERAAVLFKWRQELLNQIDTISVVTSSECGKTIAEAKAGILKGIEVLEFAISQENMDSSNRMEVSRGVTCHTQREPMGVVLGITPFNFPAMVPMWMIPNALITGNSFILKPSDKTPLTSYFLANTLMKAGLPSGVFSVIPGDKTTVEYLIDHPIISAIGFVGSSTVAKAVYQKSAQLTKRCLSLGGAKNHIILMPDADLELASRSIVDSFTGCAGQRCMAASVLVVVGNCENIIKSIVEKASQIKVGSDMGAIITQESLNRLKNAISKAKEEKLKILLDGNEFKISSELSQGNWIGPTIIDHVKPDTTWACDELFGPILSIIRVNHLEEALKIENSIPYGNAASIMTQNPVTANYFTNHAQAGMIGVNIGVPVPREPFSFGGFGMSRFGQGDITGTDGINFWTQSKKVTTKWAQQEDQTWMG